MVLWLVTELNRIWKDVGMALSHVLSLHSAAGTQKNLENPHPRVCSGRDSNPALPKYITSVAARRNLHGLNIINSNIFYKM
jgi:hypothetical protein